MASVAIVGGGVAGCLIAKLLSQFGFTVTVFERKKHLMTGASGRNWFRFHLGPHYPMDDQTAYDVMEASMAGAAYLQDYLYQGVRPPEYYIHPDPDMQQKLHGGERLDAERYRATLRRQQCQYGTLLREYPEAEEVFGQANQFFTELPSTTKNFIRGCCLGISSAERLMELSRLNNALVHEVKGSQQIGIRTSAQVEDIRWNRVERNFELSVQLPQGSQTYTFDQVVQAGWAQGIGLDLQLVNNLRCESGMTGLSGEVYGAETLHRLKVIALVKGADNDESVTHKMMMSPTAAQYGYLAPGVGIASANHIQVLGKATGLCPPEWDKALSGEDGRVHEVAQAIFAYCQPFFPFLRHAECVRGMAAVVVSGLDTGKRSGETLRDIGVGEFGVTGYHSVAGMKLSNVPLAAVTAIKAVMAADGGDFGLDPSETAEHTLRQFARSPAHRIKPAPLSVIEQMIAEETGPLEGFRWEATRSS